MRVALYARVSTANNGQDPQAQLRELREHANQRGWPVVGEYVDNGVTPVRLLTSADGTTVRRVLAVFWMTCVAYLASPTTKHWDERHPLAPAPP